MDSDLLTLSDDLRSASSLAFVDMIFANVLEFCGCAQFTYSLHGQDGLTQKPLHHILYSSELKAWRQHYCWEEYGRIDPFLVRAKTNVLPIFWDIETELTKLPGFQQAFLADALAHGIEAGVTIPIHGPNGALSVTTLYGLEIKQKLEANPNLLRDIHQFVLQYQHKVVKLLATEQRGRKVARYRAGRDDAAFAAAA